MRTLEDGLKRSERLEDPSRAKPVYYPDLDGLRAISVLLVISWHLREKTALVAHIPGWLGVYLFFVISGFLITALLIDEEARTGGINLKAFYIRRALRILPVYFFVLATYVVADLRSPAKWADLKLGLPYYLTFTNEFKPDGATIFGFTWTLGIEEKFYLVWPFVFFLIFATLRRRIWVLCGLYVGFLLLFHWAETTSASYSGLLVGCALAVLTRRWQGVADALGAVPRAALLVAMIAAFAMIDWSSRLLPVFNWVTFVLVGNLAMRGGSILASRPLVWIGKRSYSMYLIHGIVLGFIEDHTAITTTGKQLLVACLAFAVTAMGANVLYRLVEDPCRRLGRSLIASHGLKARSGA